MKIVGVVIPIPQKLVVPLIVIFAVIVVISTIYDLTVARPQKRRARKLRAAALLDPTPALLGDAPSIDGCNLGHPMPPSAKFCNECGGTRLRGSATLIPPRFSVDDRTAATAEPVSSPRPPLLKSSISPSGVKPAPSDSAPERKSFCLSGHPIQTGQLYCTTCGASLRPHE